MIRSDCSRGFALALLSLAQDDKKLTSYKRDAKDIIEALEGQSQFLTLLSLKSISIAEKMAMIKQVLKPIGNKNIQNLIGLLINRAQVKLLEKILLKLISLINKELKIKEGFIYSTTNLSKNQIKGIERFVARQIKSKVELKNLIDYELIAGLKIVVEDNVIEDNILSRIHQIKRNLLRGDK